MLFTDATLPLSNLLITNMHIDVQNKITYSYQAPVRRSAGTFGRKRLASSEAVERHVENTAPLTAPAGSAAMQLSNREIKSCKGGFPKASPSTSLNHANFFVIF